MRWVFKSCRVTSWAKYSVTIRSSDPKKAGRLGLDLAQGQIGPCLIKHVTVIGFDYGVEVAHSFSVVLEHLALEHQNVLGFFNSDGAWSPASADPPD